MRNYLIFKDIAAFFVIILLSLLGAWGVALSGGTYQYLLFIVLLAVSVVVIAMGKKTMKAGFLVWIGMFLIGYRTVRLIPGFPVHPLILYLVFLFLILLANLGTAKSTRLKLPVLLWAFSIFWLWGFFPGIQNNLLWTRMLSEALNFFFLIPVFWIILYLAQTPNFWKQAVFTFLGVGVLISLLGTVEYYFPQFLSLVPGLVQTDMVVLQSSSGFARAGFAFFGANPAVIISALALPMVWVVIKLYKGWLRIILAFPFLAILIVGIYISGTRVAWMMTLIASILLAYFAFKWIGVAVSALFWLIVSQLFPAEAMNLILSIYAPLSSGQFLDSSMSKRYARQEAAFQLALDNPWGVGWSGSGWVHGDFAQVAANLGILAGLLFLAWYLHTCYRAWKTYRKYPQDAFLQAIFTSFFLAGFILATEGVQVLPQFVMPVWFIWGLMEAYIQHKNLGSVNS